MDSTTLDRAASDDAARFLDALYPAGIPQGLHVLTWSLAGKSSAWWTDAEKCAAAVAGRDDQYVGCGLAPPGLGPRERCVASRIAGIPGVWIDVDIKDEDAHKSDNLPTTEIEAASVFPTPPSVVVHSGHGLQAWWLLPEPWIFETDADRKRAERLLAAWHLAVQHRAAKRGWKIDATGDLARVFRIPSTFNAKTSKRVPVRLRKSDGPRYDLEQLEDLCAAFTSASVHGTNANGALGKIETDWTKLIEGVEEGGRNVSAAKYCGLVIAGIRDASDNRLVRAAWLSVVAWNQANNPPLDEKELRKVFNSILKAEREKLAEDKFNETMGQYAPFGTRPGDDKAAAETKPEQESTADAADRWRLVTIMSEPKTYRLYGPIWSGRFLVLDSDQLLSPHKLCREALEQLGVAIAVPHFSGFWLGNKKKGNKGMMAQVVEATEIEKAPVEIVRTAYVAELLRQYLANAGPSSGNDEADKFRVSVGESQTQLEDGSVVFNFPHLLTRMMDKPARPTANELSAVCQKAGIRSKRPRIKGQRVSYHLATPDALKRLYEIADGQTGDDDDPAAP